jgi:hypothetical protein
MTKVMRMRQSHRKKNKKKIQSLILNQPNVENKIKKKG